MAKEINNVCRGYNGQVMFKIKSTPGDRIKLKTSHKIETSPYPEGYFMNRKSSVKTNPVLSFFKRMYTEMKGIIEAIKPDDV